jgi:hypothetical protein
MFYVRMIIRVIECYYSNFYANFHFYTKEQVQ